MKSIPEINFKKVKENDLNGFEILVLEKLIRTFKKPLNHDPFRPHRLRFFAILIITEGEVNHFVDLKRHRLQAGDVMVIAKGQIHAFDERLSYKGYMILFTEAFSFVNKKLDSFYQLKRLLEENYTTMRDAKAYASRMFFALGFDKPTNFLKYFKKQTKLTPVEFRNTLA